MPAGAEGLSPFDSVGFYDRVAAVYDKRYSLTTRQTMEQAAWLAGRCRPGPLLDLGCGTGRMFHPLSRAGFQVVGMDSSSRMLALARADHPAAHLLRADASGALPFVSGAFKAVISLHSTLVHITDENALRGLFSEIHRVLEPKGSFVAELPHPFAYPPTFTQGEWVTFDDGISFRRGGGKIHEMRLSDYHGLTTRVRLIEVDEIKEWLKGFSRVELHPGFTGGRFHPQKGHLMVVWAKK